MSLPPGTVREVLIDCARNILRSPGDARGECHRLRVEVQESHRYDFCLVMVREAARCPHRGCDNHVLRGTSFHASPSDLREPSAVAELGRLTWT